MIPKKEITSNVVDLVNCIIDLGSSEDLRWASEELSKQAEKRHEAEKAEKKLISEK